MSKKSQIKFIDNNDGTTTMSGFPHDVACTSIIDTEDVAKVKRFSNHWHLGKKTGYIRCTKDDRIVELHRVIMNTYNIKKSDTNFEVDHINRNKLDNRKENLRLVTHSENMKNRDMSPQQRFKGYIKRYNRFYVQVCLNNKCYYGGSFEDEQLAKDKALELRQRVSE